MALYRDTSDLSLWYALNRLETNYWWDVDRNGGSRAHEFYVADGLFTVGDNRFHGQHHIRAFYAWRQRRGSLTTRHLLHNLQVVSSGDRRANITAVLSLCRADGRPPVRGTRPPSLIADIDADCVWCDDEVWRYQSHAVVPVFVGSDIPLSLSIDTQILADAEHNLLEGTR
jgi:hypothetical protein